MLVLKTKTKPKSLLNLLGKMAGALRVEAGFGLNTLSVYLPLVFFLWKTHSFKLLLLFLLQDKKSGKERRSAKK